VNSGNTIEVENTLHWETLMYPSFASSVFIKRTVQIWFNPLNSSVSTLVEGGRGIRLTSTASFPCQLAFVTNRIGAAVQLLSWTTYELPTQSPLSTRGFHSKTTLLWAQLEEQAALNMMQTSMLTTEGEQTAATIGAIAASKRLACRPSPFVIGDVGELTRHSQRIALPPAGGHNADIVAAGPILSLAEAFVSATPTASSAAPLAGSTINTAAAAAPPGVESMAQNLQLYMIHCARSLLSTVLFGPSTMSHCHAPDHTLRVLASLPADKISATLLSLQLRPRHELVPFLQAVLMALQVPSNDTRPHIVLCSLTILSSALSSPELVTSSLSEDVTSTFIRSTHSPIAELLLHPNVTPTLFMALCRIATVYTRRIRHDAIRCLSALAANLHAPLPRADIIEVALMPLLRMIHGVIVRPKGTGSPLNTNGNHNSALSAASDSSKHSYTKTIVQIGLELVTNLAERYATSHLRRPAPGYGSAIPFMLVMCCKTLIKALESDPPLPVPPSLLMLVDEHIIGIAAAPFGATGEGVRYLFTEPFPCTIGGRYVECQLEAERKGRVVVGWNMEVILSSAAGAKGGRHHHHHRRNPADPTTEAQSTPQPPQATVALDDATQAQTTTDAVGDFSRLLLPSCGVVIEPSGVVHQVLNHTVIGTHDTIVDVGVVGVACFYTNGNVVLSLWDRNSPQESLAGHHAEFTFEPHANEIVTLPVCVMEHATDARLVVKQADLVHAPSASAVGGALYMLPDPIAASTKQSIARLLESEHQLQQQLPPPSRSGTAAAWGAAPVGSYEFFVQLNEMIGSLDEDTQKELTKNAIAARRHGTAAAAAIVTHQPTPTTTTTSPSLLTGETDQGPLLTSGDLPLPAATIGAELLPGDVTSPSHAAWQSVQDVTIGSSMMYVASHEVAMYPLVEQYLQQQASLAAAQAPLARTRRVGGGTVSVGGSSLYTEGGEVIFSYGNSAVASLAGTPQVDGSAVFAGLLLESATSPLGNDSTVAVVEADAVTSASGAAGSPLPPSGPVARGNSICLDPLFPFTRALAAIDVLTLELWRVVSLRQDITSLYRLWSVMKPLCGRRTREKIQQQALAPFAARTGVRANVTIHTTRALPSIRRGMSATLHHSIFGQLHHQLCSVSNAVFYASPMFQVKLAGFAAQDAGGPYREVLALLADEICTMHPGGEFQMNPLFRAVSSSEGEAAGASAIMPNPHFPWSSQTALMYEFFGKLLASFLVSADVLAVDLPGLFWKLFLDYPVSARDLTLLDPMFNHLINPDMLATMSVEEDLEEMLPGIAATWEAQRNNRRRQTQSNGRQVLPALPLPSNTTNSSSIDRRGELEQLAQCVIEFGLHRYDNAIASVREGFSAVIPLHVMRSLYWCDVETRICGTPTITADALRGECVVTLARAQLDMFWRVVNDMSPADRSLLLRFTTGQSRLPLKSKMRVDPRHDGADSLPTSATCFFTLKVPFYSSQRIMKEKILYAIRQCNAIDRDGAMNDGNLGGIAEQI
jgi:hypothetical protein